MKLTEKAAYLKGLMDGLKIDESTNEGRIMLAMAELIGEMADCIGKLTEQADETEDRIVDIENDLDCILDDYFSEDDDKDDDEEDDFDYDDDTLFECVCPTCGDTICLDENIIADGSIECPNCGESLEFDFSDIEAESEDTEE